MTDIYLQNECAHVGLSVHAPVSVCLHTAALAGALFRNQPVVLDHVQNAQIHAVRAKILTCFSAAELEWIVSSPPRGGSLAKQYIEAELGTPV